MRNQSLYIRLTLALLLSAAAAFAADFTGKWTGQFSGPAGDLTITFNLKQAGAKLTGTVNSPAGDLEIQDGKVDGDKMLFTVSFNEMKIQHEGVLKGDEITLTVKMDGAESPGSMTLKREK